VPGCRLVGAGGVSEKWKELEEEKEGRWVAPGERGSVAMILVNIRQGEENYTIRDGFSASYDGRCCGLRATMWFWVNQGKQLDAEIPCLLVSYEK